MSLSLQTAVIGALQRLPDEAKPHLGDMRREISDVLQRTITPADLRQAIEALWFKGKLEFNTLRLSPSMRCERGPELARRRTANGKIDLRNAPSGMELMAAQWRTRASA